MRTSTSRGLLQTGSLLLILAAGSLYGYWIQRAYRAAAWSEASDGEGIRRAVRIEPLSAEYLDHLGRYESFIDANSSAAQASFRRAIELCPSNARYWLDLAQAQVLSGDIVGFKPTVMKAIDLDPTAPDRMREAMVLYLAFSDIRQSLPLYSRLLAADNPGNLADDLLMLWRTTKDAPLIVNQALPPRADIYVTFLRLLVSRKETAAAQLVFDRLLALKQPFDPPDVIPYFDLLLEAHDPRQLASAWGQLAAAVPEMNAYQASGDNLLVNPGFKLDILNGGLDWRYEHLPHVMLSLDSNSYRRAPRSITFEFDGAPTEIHFFQYVPVQPNTTYRLSGYFKSDGLDTASGPRLFVSDAFTNRRMLLSNDVLGTTPWLERGGEFRTDADTKLVIVGVTREPATDLIKGKAWLDDLQLTAK